MREMVNEIREIGENKRNGERLDKDQGRVNGVW